MTGFSLSDDEKRILLGIAREAVLSALERRPPRRPAPSPALRRRSGAFVTLRSPEGALRGCIGSIAGTRPLDETVEEMAGAAAFQDPRFRSVSRDEFDGLRFEISVLSPLRRAESPEEVVPGTHGIYIKRGPGAGLLLPQVAVEQGWDRERFLDHGCMKAGLPPETWKTPGTEIFIFTALVFSE